MGRPKGSTNKVKKAAVKAEKTVTAAPAGVKRVDNVAELAIEVIKLNRDIQSLAQSIHNFTTQFTSGIQQMSTAIENDMRNIDGRVKALEEKVLPKTGDNRTAAETVAAATQAPKLAVVPPVSKEETPIDKVTNLL